MPRQKARCTVPTTWTPCYLQERYHTPGRDKPMTFLALLALAAAIKCFSLGRRPTTNGKCTTGLALIFLSIFLLWVADLAGEMQEHSLHAALITVGAILDLLMGGVLSVMGLSELSEADPPFLQGRKQAIAGLVILALVLLALLGKYGNRMAKIEKEHAKPKVYEKFNFSFAPPPRGWFRVSPKSLNPQAILAFRHRRPNLFFMVIAETGAYSAGVNTEKIVSIAKSTLVNVDEKAQIQDGDDIQTTDLTFKTFNSRATVQKQRAVYTHAVAVHNGYAYQLVTFAVEEKPESVDAAARTMAHLFRLIDPDRVDLGEEASLVDDHESKRFGFSMDLSDHKWFTSPSLEAEYPKSEFVASLAGQAWIQVIPIVLDQHDPPIEASLQSLLALQGFEYPESSIQDRKDPKSNTRQEVRFRYKKDEPEGAHIAICRVIQTENLLYYIEGWFYEGSESREKAVETAVSKVRVSAPTERLKLDLLSPQEKGREAIYFNEVGYHFYSQQALEKAKGYFLLSLSLTPENVTLLINVNNCLFGLRQYKEALRFLSQHTNAIRHNRTLLADRAWLLAWSGQDDEAIGIYEKLFADGLTDKDHLFIMIDLLERKQRTEDALLLMERVRKKSDGPLLQARHAKLLLASKRPKDAIQLLMALPTPRHPDVRRTLIEAYRADKRLPEALKVVDSLLADGYASPRTYHTKASIEMDMGNLDRAAKTTSLALQRYKHDAELRKLDLAIQKRLTKSSSKGK